MTDQRLTDQHLDDIETRAASLYEYATLTDAPLQADADQTTGEDIPALLAALRGLRAELDAEKSAHRFTLRQRNNRSTRLIELRDMALAGDTKTLLTAAKDTLAASRTDHDTCGPAVVSAAADTPGTEG